MIRKTFLKFISENNNVDDNIAELTQSLHAHGHLEMFCKGVSARLEKEFGMQEAVDFCHDQFEKCMLIDLPGMTQVCIKCLIYEFFQSSFSLSLFLC